MNALTATTEPDRLATAVIEAIADAADTDPMEMGPPLYTVVDMDALQSVLASDAGVRVTFEYDGRTVTARSDGTVVVDGERYDTTEEDRR